MADTYDYGWVLLLIAAVGVAAVLSNRLTARLRVPVPLVLLAAAAAAVQLIPDLQAPPVRTVDRLVTVALVFILFNGGMHIGWRRFKTAAGPIVVVGIAGTFLTTAGAGVILLVVVGLAWYPALLVAPAVATSAPVVVF